ncbi:MAG: sulfurtransferase, partial [Rhodospirillales bacterium]|nr:sulfurtransferase [Rhodospirillales bacterium]
VSDQPPAPRRAQYTARHNAALVRGIDDILANLAKHREQVIDARPAGRFAGSDPEPRPVKKQGHVPGSANIPAATLVDSYRHGLWRSPEDLARAFEDAGVNWRKPMITTCGSGVTACYTALAAFLLGNKTAAVYDGSWAEWGNRDDTPVEP